MRVFVSAGEVSGDRLAARVMKAWRQCRPTLAFAGCAGEAMRAVGCQSLAHSETFSHVGWSSVVQQLPLLVWKHLLLQHRLQTWQPEMLVFVDAPGLHLPILKKWKKRGVPCVWIAPPQLWAWRERSIPTLQDVAVVPLHQFEVPALQAQGARAHWFGYLGECPEQTARPDARFLALLPGSRAAWRQRHGQLFAQAGVLAGQRLGLTPVMVSPFGNESSLYGLPVLQPLEAFADAGLVLGMPGTGLLEASLHGVPSVAAAQPSALDRWMAQRRVNLGSLVLTNRILNQNIVPEAYAPHLTPAVLSQMLVDVAAQAGPIREQLGHLRERMQINGSLPALVQALDRGTLFASPTKTSF